MTYEQFKTCAAAAISIAEVCFLLRGESQPEGKLEYLLERSRDARNAWDVVADNIEDELSRRLRRTS